MMKANQSKSFRNAKEQTQQGNLFTRRQDMDHSYYEPVEPGVDVATIIKKTMQVIQKLMVALKYQLFKLSGGKLTFGKNTPWFKIGLVALLAFLMFKKDFSFTIGMKSPEAAIIGDDDKKDNKTTQFGVATPAAQKEVINPFAELPNDDARTKRDKAYIRRYQKVAQEEMAKYGIPASIKVAQGLLESGAGTSRLAKENKNHFGIKCFSKSCKKGHCANFSDDHHKDFFRKYKSVWESWRSHSKLLKSKHYKSLFANGTDYRAWAHGLKKLGYATDPNYAETLIKKIEKYQLYYLDK